jgi:alpha-L-fucosidase 2
MGVGMDMEWAPVQLDANMGWSAAIHEMLLFSKNSYLSIIPALPSRWIRGSIKGMLCRGAIKADIDWDMSINKICISLTSENTQEIKLKLPKPIMSLKCEGLNYGRVNECIVEYIELECKKTYEIEVQLQS